MLSCVYYTTTTTTTYYYYYYYYFDNLIPTIKLLYRFIEFLLIVGVYHFQTLHLSLEIFLLVSWDFRLYYTRKEIRELTLFH